MLFVPAEHALGEVASVVLPGVADADNLPEVSVEGVFRYSSSFLPQSSRMSSGSGAGMVSMSKVIMRRMVVPPSLPFTLMCAPAGELFKRGGTHAKAARRKGTQRRGMERGLDGSDGFTRIKSRDQQRVAQWPVASSEGMGNCKTLKKYSLTEHPLASNYIIRPPSNQSENSSLSTKEFP